MILHLIVLRVFRRHARCRTLGAVPHDRVVLRTVDVAEVVPGEIAIVRVRRRWTELGETHVTGDVVDVRLDPATLGLEPLHMCTEDPEAPEPELEFLLAGRRTEPLPDELPSDAEHAAALLEVDLRCLAAHARLGDEVFGRDPGDAVRYYEAGLRIGELSLCHLGGARLSARYKDNLGFLRCLHGRARCRWRADCWAVAEHDLERLLALDPADVLGAAAELEAVRARRSWDHYLAIERVA